MHADWWRQIMRRRILKIWGQHKGKIAGKRDAPYEKPARQDDAHDGKRARQKWVKLKCRASKGVFRALLKSLSMDLWILVTFSYNVFSWWWVEMSQYADQKGNYLLTEVSRLILPWSIYHIYRLSVSRIVHALWASVILLYSNIFHSKYRLNHFWNLMDKFILFKQGI